MTKSDHLSFCPLKNPPTGKYGKYQPTNTTHTQDQRQVLCPVGCWEGRPSALSPGLGLGSLPVLSCAHPRQQGAQSAWPEGSLHKAQPLSLQGSIQQRRILSRVTRGGRKEGCGWKIALEPKVGHLHESPIIAPVAKRPTLPGQFSSPHFPVSP